MTNKEKDKRIYDILNQYFPVENVTRVKDDELPNTFHVNVLVKDCLGRYSHEQVRRMMPGIVRVIRRHLNLDGDPRFGLYYPGSDYPEIPQGHTCIQLDVHI